MRDGDAGTARFGARVREERTRAGLSARALAARAGVAHVTVSAIERGRDASASTARALLDALPGLRVEDVLATASTASAPWTPGEWDALARLHGFEARTLRLTVIVRGDGRLVSELRVDGLRPTRGSLADPDRRMAVLGAPLIGRALELVFGLGRARAPSGRRHVLRVGDVEHALWLPRDLEAGEARYRRRDLRPVAADESLAEQSPHGRPFATGACAWVDHPVRRLVIAVRFPTDRVPDAVRVMAWPATLATAPGEDVDSWPDLLPQAPRVVIPQGAEAVMEVERPAPGTCFALCWGEALASPSAGWRRASSPVSVAPVVRRPVAAILRHAREAAGFSRRELARRMGVSPASVVEAERGREPRLSALGRALHALPGLTAAELFPPPAAMPGLDVIRERQARRFGLQADLETCDVRISPAGDATVEVKRAGLRWLGTPGRRVRVRLGPTRGPQTATRWEIEGIDAEGGEDDPTVRVVSRARGPTVHELRFLAARLDRPLTHVRRLTVRGQVAMRPDSPGVTRDERGRRAEAVYLEPSLPSRTLRLHVRLPRGYWPDDIVACVVPRACGPTWHPEDLASRAHPEGLRLDADERRRRIVLEVDGPLVGLRYQILWFLDDGAGSAC